MYAAAVDLPRWMPRPAAWASALALFVFAMGVRTLFALVMPLLFALVRHSPRLGGLGLLLLWLSPMALAAGLHDLVARFIGLKAPVPGGSWLGDPSSWWLGFVAWATIIVVSIAMAFVMLVVDPPPADPDALGSLVAAVTRRQGFGAGSGVWIALAAYVYELELKARETAP
jgi:hypothetical protein